MVFHKSDDKKDMAHIDESPWHIVFVLLFCIKNEAKMTKNDLKMALRSRHV